MAVARLATVFLCAAFVGLVRGRLIKGRVSEFHEDSPWVLEVHPLRELVDHQFLDALNQVVMAAKNYGSSWSSGNLVFGGGE